MQLGTRYVFASRGTIPVAIRPYTTALEPKPGDIAAISTERERKGKKQTAQRIRTVLLGLVKAREIHLCRGQLTRCYIYARYEPCSGWEIILKQNPVVFVARN